MSAAENHVVRFAAVLLPSHLRDRYREQWLGELRDAHEVGIPPSEIARAALMFAAKIERPFPRSTRSRTEVVELRTRAAIGLSLSAALLAVSQFGSIATSPDSTMGSDFFGFTVFVSTMLSFIYGALAPLVAVSLIFATRGVSSYARVAVALFAVASAAPPLARLVYTEFFWVGDMYLNPWNASYPSALMLVLIGCYVLWNDPAVVARSTSPKRLIRRLRDSCAAALVVGAVASLSFAFAHSVWSTRFTPRWDAPVTASNRAEFEQWIAINALYEEFVETALSLGLAAALAAALALAASGFNPRSTSRLSIRLMLGALFVWLVYSTAVSSLVALTVLGRSVPLESNLILLAGQCTMIVIVLAASGGKLESGTRDAARTRQRREKLKATDPTPSMLTSGK